MFVEAMPAFSGSRKGTEAPENEGKTMVEVVCRKGAVVFVVQNATVQLYIYELSLDGTS